MSELKFAGESGISPAARMNEDPPQPWCGQRSFGKQQGCIPSPPTRGHIRGREWEAGVSMAERPWQVTPLPHVSVGAEQGLGTCMSTGQEPDAGPDPMSWCCWHRLVNEAPESHHRDAHSPQFANQFPCHTKKQEEAIWRTRGDQQMSATDAEI